MKTKVKFLNLPTSRTSGVWKVDDEGYIDGYCNDAISGMFYAVVVIMKGDTDILSSLVLCPISDLECIGIMDLMGEKEFVKNDL